MNKLKIKQFFCRHKNTKFFMNLHGDQINRYSTSKEVYRSLWQCQKCGKIIGNHYYYKEQEKEKGEDNE